MLIIVKTACAKVIRILLLAVPLCLSENRSTASSIPKDGMSKRQIGSLHLVDNLVKGKFSPFGKATSINQISVHRRSTTWSTANVTVLDRVDAHMRRCRSRFKHHLHKRTPLLDLTAIVGIVLNLGGTDSDDTKSNSRGNTRSKNTYDDGNQQDTTSGTHKSTKPSLSDLHIPVNNSNTSHTGSQNGQSDSNSPSDHQQSSVPPKQSPSVEKSNVDNSDDDNEFLIRMQVGTPGQELWMTPDTASPSTWVYGPECCYLRSHNYFRPNESSTIRTVNGNKVTFHDGLPTQEGGVGTSQVSYGVGSQEITLIYLKDVLTIVAKPMSASDKDDDYSDNETAIPTDGSLKAYDQIFGIVTKNEDEGRKLRKSEGTLGFSPGIGSKLQEPNYATPMETLVRAGALEQPIVSFTFVKKQDASDEGEGGRMTLGALDHEAIDGEVTWIDSTATSYWGTEFADNDSIRVAGQDVYSINSSLTRRWIVDTGSAIVFLPAQVAAYANSLLENAYYTNESKRWTISCAYGQGQGEQSQHSPLTFHVAGRVFGIPAADIVLFPDDPLTTNPQTGEKYCLTTIQEGPEDFAIFGNAFIKNHVLALDYGDETFTKKRIGLAKRMDVKYETDRRKRT